MNVAILSDIHENLHNLALFFRAIETLQVERILCLGDLMNNGIAQILAQSPIPVFSIFGNNDGDRVAVMRTSLAKESKLQFGFSTYDVIEIDGKKVFLTHYPLLVKSMARSGDFDAIFYGHNHQKHIEKVGNCLIVNPGEISAHKTKMASFAIWDSTTNEAHIIELSGVFQQRP